MLAQILVSILINIFGATNVHADRDGNVCATYINEAPAGWFQAIREAADKQPDYTRSLYALLMGKYGCQYTSHPGPKGMHYGIHFLIKYPY